MGMGGRIVFVVLAILVLGGILLFSGSGDPVAEENINVKLEMTQGDVVVELFLSEMPVTAGNFKKLVEEGFYDGLIFHRVIPGFMIQGGDPKGDGTGGPGYTIKDEFGNVGNDRGTLSMANSGPNTGGSQFFINVADNNFLDGKHPVFGKVVEGMDVIDAILGVERGSGDRPVVDVVIKKASVLS